MTIVLYTLITISLALGIPAGWVAFKSLRKKGMI